MWGPKQQLMGVTCSAACAAAGRGIKQLASITLSYDPGMRSAADVLRVGTSFFRCFTGGHAMMSL